MLGIASQIATWAEYFRCARKENAAAETSMSVGKPEEEFQLIDQRTGLAALNVGNECQDLLTYLCTWK